MILNLILDDIKDSLSDVINFGPDTVIITVSKPYCSPAENIIMTTLNTYGVKVYDYEEVEKKISLKQVTRQFKLSSGAFQEGAATIPKLFPIAVVAKVKVSTKQAVWAEYLLLRTKQLAIVGAYQDERNQEWASKHKVMPPCFTKPWIEKSCSEGTQSWDTLKKAIKKPPKPQNNTRY